MTAPTSLGSDAASARDPRIDSLYPTLEAQSVQTATRTHAGWLGLVESWHQSSRHPGVVLVDAAVVTLAAAGVSGSARAGILAGLAVVVVGLVTGLFRPRCSLQTQGVAWYARAAAPTAVGVWAALRTGMFATSARSAWLVVLVAGLALLGGRAAAWLAIAGARRQGLGLRDTLVIAPADRVEQLRHRMATFPEAGLRFEAAHVPRPGDGATPEAGRALVAHLLGRHPVDHVLCVADDVDETVFRDFLRYGRDRVDCSMILPLAGHFASQTQARLGDLGIVPVRLKPAWGTMAVKRAFDLTAAVLGLLVISPLLVVTAVAIKAGDGGPVLFRQQRVGRHGQVFAVWKFRSMVVDAEARRQQYLADNVNRGLLFKLDADPRITRVGGWIRRLSIDELPQLVNVIRGEMSLVGPRPLPVDPDEFDLAAQIRHQVPPGITGLWQVHGANALTYDDMVDLDLTYVTTRSFGHDLLLLARTVPALLVRRSAY